MPPKHVVAARAAGRARPGAPAAPAGEPSSPSAAAGGSAAGGGGAACVEPGVPRGLEARRPRRRRQPPRPLASPPLRPCPYASPRPRPLPSSPLDANAN